MIDGLVRVLLEWICFWRSDWSDDDAPEATRAPRWVRLLVVLLVVVATVAWAFMRV